MGGDKAWIEVEGRPLHERAFSLLANVCGEVRLSVRGNQLLRLGPERRTCAIPDSLDSAGPISGLLSAWEREPAAAWLVLACDYAAVTGPTLEMLVRNRDPAAAATAFRLPGAHRPEPLCTIYEPACRAGLDARFRQGRRSLSGFLADSRARILEAPRPREFQSLNTPGEFERFLRRGNHRLNS